MLSIMSEPPKKVGLKTALTLAEVEEIFAFPPHTTRVLGTGGENPYLGPMVPPSTAGGPGADFVSRKASASQSHASDALEPPPSSPRARPRITFPSSAPEHFALDFANTTSINGNAGFNPSRLLGVRNCSDRTGPSYPDHNESSTIPEHGALEEVGKPIEPSVGYNLDSMEALEHKEGEPYKPNDDNAYYIPNNDDEPEGSTAPDKRRHTALPSMKLASDPQPSPSIDKPPGAPRKKGIGGHDSDQLKGIKTRPGEGAVEGDEPPKPSETNATTDVPNNDDEPEGSTQPDDRRKRAALPSMKRDSDPQPSPSIDKPPGAPRKRAIISDGNVERAGDFKTITEPIEPMLDFIGEEHGNQDAGAVPGIVQALVNDLIVSLQGSLMTCDGGDRPPRPRSPSPERPKRCILAC